MAGLGVLDSGDRWSVSGHFDIPAENRDAGGGRRDRMRYCARKPWLRAPA